MDMMTAAGAPPRPGLLNRLRPFHPVALKLMRTAASEQASIAEIASIVRCDAAFAAELLRLANSPLFGFTREISSVLQAIGLIGMERVRALALTVALRRLVGDAHHSETARICWRHNLACALIAEELAIAGLLAADTLYTAGLVHDLGRMAMLSIDARRYQELMDAAEDEPRELRRLEREAFGLDHCEAGATLAANWDFPESLCRVTAEHHDPPDPGGASLLDVVKLACRTADALGFQVAGPAPRLDLRDVLEILPPTARGRLRGNASELATAIAIKINSLEICV